MKTENRNYQINHLGIKSYEIEEDFQEDEDDLHDLEEELRSDYWDAVINKAT